MKKLVFCLSLCGIILAGCKNDPSIVPDNDDHQIAVIFSAPSVSSSLLKATTEEKTISEVILFGVDAQDNIVPIEHSVLVGQDLDDALVSGTTIRLLKTITTLYAIANPSSTFDAGDPSTLTELLALTDDFTDEPNSSSLLMSGKGQIDAGTKSAQIQLIRAVAKVEIIGLNDFEITSVQVMKTPDTGWVFEQASFSIPTNTPVNYSEVLFTDPDDDKIFYVAENELPGTEIVITGNFNSKVLNYTLNSLSLEGVAIDQIVRNTHYKVGIFPLPDGDFAVTITIPDWDEVDADDVNI